MTRWLHYIGGYYSPDKFIRETKRHGMNRKVAPNVASAMEYGDTVICLEWNHREPHAFAECVINGVSFPAEITGRLGQKLVDDGQATERQGSGAVIVRECGSYVDGGGYVVGEGVKLSYLAKKAKEIAAELGIELSCFVSGRLSKVHTPPVVVQPYPPFTRGFMRVRNESLWDCDPNAIVIDNEPQPNAVNGIISYAKRRNKERKDLNLRLLPSGD